MESGMLAILTKTECQRLNFILDIPLKKLEKTMVLVLIITQRAIMEESKKGTITLSPIQR